MHSHWLVNGFVLFGAPYMASDIYAMYLSHYNIQKVKGHNEDHSPQTVKAFLIRDWMLVLHHLALLLIFMPITLVRRAENKILYYTNSTATIWCKCVYTYIHTHWQFAWSPVLQKRTWWFLHWLSVHHRVQHNLSLHCKNFHPGKPHVHIIICCCCVCFLTKTQLRETHCGLPMMDLQSFISARDLRIEYNCIFSGQMPCHNSLAILFFY